MAIAAVFAAGVAVRVWFLAQGPPAFLGYTDAWSYVALAQGKHAQDQVHPDGYPLFLRLTHAITAHISWTVLVQHALGVATAFLLYAAVARTTRSRLAGVVPAVFVLFDGLQIVMEHTLLTEAVFSFAVAAFLYAGIRGLDGSMPFVALAGVSAACAGLVKSAGLLLVGLLLVLLLVRHVRGGGLSRVMPAALAALAAVVVLAAYLGWLAGEPGSPDVSLSPATGRVLYSRVAPFADCRDFSVPAGTGRLCEPSASDSRRQGTNYYLWSAENPAWRAYGPPPGGDGRLRSFAVAAILGQPGDYLSAVWKDLSRFFVTRNNPDYVDLAKQNLPIVVDQTARYYGYRPAASNPGAAPLVDYSRATMTRGWIVLLLFLAPVASLALTRDLERWGVALFAATGWLLALGLAANANYDTRFPLAVIGPLAAASAPAILRLARGTRARARSRWHAG